MVAIFVVGIGICKSASAEDNRFLGEIALFVGDYVPAGGWVACDGKKSSISEHQALYSVIGDTYGGDGVTTFKVPDLRNAEAKLRASTGVQAGKKIEIYHAYHWYISK